MCRMEIEQFMIDTSGSVIKVRQGAESVTRPSRTPAAASRRSVKKSRRRSPQNRKIVLYQDVPTPAGSFTGPGGQVWRIRIVDGMGEHE